MGTLSRFCRPVPERYRGNARTRRGLTHIILSLSFSHLGRARCFASEEDARSGREGESSASTIIVVVVVVVVVVAAPGGKMLGNFGNPFRVSKSTFDSVDASDTL